MSDDEIARNPVDDRVVDLLERTLAAHADTASASPDLAGRARSRRRHRAVRRAGVVGGVALAATAAIVVPMVIADDGTTPRDVPVVAPLVEGLPPVEAPADGWRWETYGGVELQVPDDWGYGVNGTQWCGGEGSTYVGRNGLLPLMLCNQSQDPPENKNRYVEFHPVGQHGAEPGRAEFPGGWVREGRQVGQMVVTVQLDDAALADQILDTARAVESVDAFGCPATAAPAESLDARPTAGALVPENVLPEGVVCQYAIGSLPPFPPDQPLMASYRMSPDEVAAFVAGVSAAPVGGGPDSPADCSEDSRRGSEAIVVRLATTEGLRDVYVWYSGCIHGIDDGVTLRALTVDALAPVFGGSVRAVMGTNDSAAEILSGATGAYG